MGSLKKLSRLSEVYDNHNRNLSPVLKKDKRISTKINENLKEPLKILKINITPVKKKQEIKPKIVETNKAMLHDNYYLRTPDIIDEKIKTQFNSHHLLNSTKQNKIQSIYLSELEKLNSYIDKIITIEKTIDILIKLIRIPAVFQGSKESISTLKLLLKKITDFEGIAISDKALTADSLIQFPITLPCKLEELYDLLRKYKEQALASIGIYSVDEKRERIVTSEIMAQNDYVDFVYSNMYNERKLAIDLVNEKYGLHIKINEVYTENKKDEMDINAYGINKVEQAKANATIKVEEIKNEGDVKVAEIESKGDNNVPY